VGGQRNWVSAKKHENTANWDNLVPETWDEDDLFSSIKIAMLSRRMFLTAKGYIGLGPSVRNFGDKVCVLFGGQMLYILCENG
jgi:hypothetical protein